ncbi:MAG: TetR/AcrR family transcriptional regulator [Pseudomonas marincola]
MSNRDRIRLESLKLFNQHGAENVGCNKIAASLGISPGNLYYHFKNKEEIIRSLFDDIEKDIEIVLHPIYADDEQPYPPEQAARILISWMMLVWRYRFFFGGLLGLTRNDELLRERYVACRIKSMSHLFQSFAAEAGNIDTNSKPHLKQMVAAIATNVWIIATGWMRHLQITSQLEPLSPDMIVDGAFQIFASVAAYLPPERVRDISELLNNREFRQEFIDAENWKD